MKKSILFHGTVLMFGLSATPAMSQWVLTDVTNADVEALVSKDGYLFCGMYGSVKRSSDNGNTWTAFNSGLPSLTTIYDMVVQGDAIIAGANDGVYRSTDNGESWTQVIDNGSYYRALKVHGSDIFAGDDYRVQRSSDNGVTWSSASTGLPQFPNNSSVYDMETLGSDLYAGTWDAGVFKSTNNGGSWVAVNTGLPTLEVRQIFARGNDLIVSTFNAGLFVSSDDAGTWSPLGTLPSVREMIMHGTTLIAATGGGVHISEDGGANWTQFNTGLTNNDILALIVSEPYLFAGGWGAWRRLLAELPVGLPELALSPATIHPCTPNPASDVVSFRFDMERSASVTAELYDALGRSCGVVYAGIAEPGEHRIPWNASALASGWYNIILRVDEHNSTQSVMIIR